MAAVGSGPNKNRYKLRKTGSSPADTGNHQNPLVFSASSYVALTVLFTGMCAFQFALVKSVLKQFSGLTYFFVLIVIAFAIVSAIDYFAGKSGKESK